MRDVRRHPKASAVGSTQAGIRCARFGIACICVLGLAAFLGSGAPSALAAEAECPNEAIRAESNINPTTGQPYSQGLPDCRAYEMVSPPDKQGQSANLLGDIGVVAPDGNALGYGSYGVFAGLNTYDGAGSNPYLAKRSTSGWTSIGLFPPPSILAGTPYSALGPGGAVFGGAAFSADLSQVAACQGASDTNSAEGRGSGLAAVCALRASDGSWTGSPAFETVGAGVVGGLEISGGSADLSHIVFQGPGASPLLPADTSGGGLYEVEGLDTPSPLLRLVNVDSNGNQIGTTAPSNLGSNEGSGASGDAYQAISTDGNTIYFTATPTGGVKTVYARIDHATTVAISNPSPSQCTTCNPTAQAGTYQGASADGSKSLFLTSQQLLNADTDSTADLYEYNLDAPTSQKLVQVSGGGVGDLTPGTGAEVQGVVRVSEDGSRVYFVAKGVLTTLPDGLGNVAQRGSDNMYVFDTDSGQTQFVATLAAGDSKLWATLDSPTNDPTQGREAQTTPEGRYLVFSTLAPLTSDDTDNAQDVYRYDANTGNLVRVSHGAGSGGASDFGNDGNTPGMNATIQPVHGDIPGPGSNQVGRAISEDGSYIIFSTPEALQSDDVNGGTTASVCNGAGTNTVNAGCDVYEWHEGTVAMISDGQAPAGADLGYTVGFPFQPGFAGMSPSGSNIFFTAQPALVGQDTDTLGDIYDARIDGGFPYTAPNSCTESETCQGPATQSTPATTTPGSSAFAGPGNEPTPPPHKKKSHHKKKSPKRSHKRQAKRASHDRGGVK